MDNLQLSCVGVKRTVSVPEPEYSVQGTLLQAVIVQCHLVKGICGNLTIMGYAGKSKVPSMNKARFRLGSHAMDA